MLQDQFTEICRAAILADEAVDHMNCRVLEPFFQQLIALAKPNDENRAELVECFIAVMHGRIEAPYETMAYCMRALKYEEILKASEERLGDPPHPRGISYHSELVHAFEDEVWEDADMWEQMR